MVISAVRVEIPTAVGAETSTQPDELEIAAAIAAVLCCIEDADNKSLLTGATTIGESKNTGWGRAAFGEATGGARVVAPLTGCKLSPWQASAFFKVCLSLPVACLSILLFTAQVKAQDAQVSLRELPSEQQEADSTYTVQRTDNTYVKKSPQLQSAAHYLPVTLGTTTSRVSSATQTAPAATPGKNGRPSSYSRVTPAQGYPFVTGKAAASSTYQADARPRYGSVPYSTPVKTGGAMTKDGWMVDSDNSQDETPLSPQLLAPGKKGTQIFETAQAEGDDTLGLESTTIKTTTIKGSSQVVLDPAIQALVQAANQINPVFVSGGNGSGNSNGGRKTTIKVGLAFSNTRLELAAIDGAQVRDASGGGVVANLNPSSRWDIALQNAGRSTQLAFVNKRPGDASSAQSGDTTVSTAGSETSRYKNVAFYPGAAAANSPANIRLPMRFGNDGDLSDSQPAASSGYIISPRSSDPNSVLVVGGRLYRGSIWLKPLPRLVAAGQYKAAAFDIINIVDLEDYLLSVVPSEMPSGWPVEALKAQAIAARSYAVANVGKHGRDGYDLKATIDDQVYSGISTESDNSNLAVAQTTGLVLKHEGKAITAFFHSTSGGSTEFSENVWGKPLPYLRSVPDFDDASPHFSWTKRVSIDDLERTVASDIGHLTSMSIVSRTGSNRAQTIIVQGSNGSKTISGEALRRTFKLPSTLFNVGADANSYIFAGRGFGHGLGMSQYGAKALAERGCNAAQILSYYYKDVTVDNATVAPSI